ncbi:hypothetical protein L1286_09355 [Pseudoalteromonas sp. SMS1]|uniref:NACHT domain-containing protein n=1 Tax=Pseudoalteromonas sp. SMS1 TaxID=2908894 RepID=UPI001F29AA6D|nr:hypothetical protein [Pseudoalteromonas sp. SMS1]MCF2857677.1 hypothetical protein [Pseudoalteromonas sp. SMS1]
MRNIKDIEPNYVSNKVLINLARKLLIIFLNKRSERAKEIKELKKIVPGIRELVKYYVEPRCQDRNPAQQDEEEPRFHPHQPVFEKINEVFSHGFPKGEGRNQLFILADAGMGKTSLLTIIKLMHIASFLPKKGECIFLKLGCDSLEKISQVDDPSNTILLLDSLDEDPTAVGKSTEARIEELLKHTAHFHRVIITCRTQFFPLDREIEYERNKMVDIAGYKCPILYLSLFREDEVKKYLRLRFGNFVQRKVSWVPCKRSANTYKSISKMGSLQLRPLLLSYIEDVVETIQNDQGEYYIYKKLVDAWLDREVRRLRNKGIKISNSDIFQVCIWIAEKLTRDNKETISLLEIGRFCETSSNIEILKSCKDVIIEGINNIDISGNSLLNKKYSGDFRFSHLTLREFLFAFGYINNRLKNKNEKTYIPLNSLDFFSSCEIPSFSNGLLFTEEDAGLYQYGKFKASKSIKSGFFLRESFLASNLDNAEDSLCPKESSTIYKEINQKILLKMNNEAKVTKEDAFYIKRISNKSNSEENKPLPLKTSKNKSKVENLTAHTSLIFDVEITLNSESTQAIKRESSFKFCALENCTLLTTDCFPLKAKFCTFQSSKIVTNKASIKKSSFKEVDINGWTIIESNILLDINVKDGKLNIHSNHKKTDTVKVKSPFGKTKTYKVNKATHIVLNL